LGWNSNFFYGNDSENWCTDVPNYGEVWYENIYDGIDLRYYTNENGLKYDFILHPGANLNHIRIRYDGAESLEIDKSNNLVIKTEIENIIERDLFIYQEYDSKCHEIEGRFYKYNDQEYGFELLDHYCESRDLIIDPYIYSTYVGGSEWDSGSGISIDPDGNAFVSGATSSINFPTTPGVYNRSFANETDVIVFKLNQDGSALHYSTYIGGKLDDQGTSIAIDSKGNAFVTGYTESTDFPTTNGTFDRTYNGPTIPNFSGWGDIFVLRLNPNGSELNYSTYIGGDNHEWGPDIEVDPAGRAFVKGVTNSSNFPNTTGAFDTSFSGESDSYVLKLNARGSRLLYSTFIGGSGSEICSFYNIGGIEIDFIGNALITGSTNSSDFPTTEGVYQQNLAGGHDVYITKLNWNGSKVLYSTLIGGSGDDAGIDICMDVEGNAYIAGMTNSINFPTTPQACNSSYIGGVTDIIVLKINPNGSKLVYSTYVGGDNYDTCWNSALDLNGCIMVTGNTNSPNFPVTQNAIQPGFNGNYDGYVFRLNYNGSKLNYSTFLSGTSLNYAGGVDVDLIGNVCVVGSTYSSDFFTTPGAFDESFNGFSDCYVVKFPLPYYSAFVIQSVSLLLNSTPIDIAYSRYDTYTIRVKLVNTEDISDLVHVSLLLDPLGKNIELLFHPSPGLFSILNDDDNSISLNSSSNFYYYNSQWIIDFNLTFNWNYPDEDFHDIHAFAVSETLPSIRHNVSNLFRVENDLVFNGSLVVTGENNRTITENALVRGREILNWSGLEVVYENTSNVYPPDNEYNVTIWHDNVQLGSDSPSPGSNFSIQTNADPFTDIDGYTHVINISKIPAYCDKTNESFTIKIDGDNVTFTNPIPDDTIWQNHSDVNIGVTITDIGGGIVNGSTIMHSISNDNGTTWSNWTIISSLVSLPSINVTNSVQFDDGVKNLIRWSAKDSVGNGPAVSESYRILVDTERVFFSDPVPSFNQISAQEEVQVGINISDNTSGVNASKITYSTSINSGRTWSSWKAIDGFQNGEVVDVKLNLNFTNGTSNYIRWCAYDIAGNGPTYSNEYVINVDIPRPPIIKKPKLELLSPNNNSKITKTSVELSWEVIKNYHPSIIFDIKLGTHNPPQDIIEKDYNVTHLIVDQLENEQTYYWTVIPRLNNINGTCLSGIWAFSVDIPLPMVTLISPIDGSTIQATKPTLIWSLEYTGSDVVKYDFYFGTDANPEIYQKNITTRYFSLDFTLEDNNTYYWFVEPWIDKLKGYRSPIWSFTVKEILIEKPKFKLNLSLDPKGLVIIPGQILFVEAIVTNLGDLTDNFTVFAEAELGFYSKLDVEVYRNITLEIGSGKSKIFLVMVSVKKDSVPGLENITITAESELDARYGLNVEKSEELIVIILEKDKVKSSGSSSNTVYLILLIILILIIILIILLISRHRKKDQTEGHQEEEENNEE
jgi:hypothetical protein